MPDLTLSVCPSPPDFSARRAGWLLLTLVTVAGVLYCALGHCLPSPYIFVDELRHVELARNFTRFHRMAYFGQATNFPNWLYPALLAPLVDAWPMIQADAGIHALNALFAALLPLFVYFWARELMDRRRALGGALLAALMPGLGYSGVAMADCLYALFVTLALWTAWRAICRPNFERCLLAGFVAGFCFQIKPQALTLPLILAAAAVWSASDCLRLPGALGSRLRRCSIEFLGFWPLALGWVIGFAPRILEVLLVERPGQPLTLAALLGEYAGQARGQHPATLGALALSLLGYGAGWTICSGIDPTLRLARETRRAFRPGPGRPAAQLVRLALLSALAVIVMSARHTLAVDDAWQFYERYTFAVLPPTLILFAMQLERRSGRPSRRIAPRVALLAVLGILGAFILRRMIWTMLSDSPSLSGFLIFMPEMRVASWLHGFPLLFILCGAAALAAWVVAPRGGFALLFAVAGLLVWFNLGWYGVQATINRRFHQESLTEVRKITQTLASDDKLLILGEGLDQRLIWELQYYTATRVLWLEPKTRPWWAEFAVLSSDRRILSPFDLSHSWLAAPRSLKFNRRPVKKFKGVALYYLGDPSPLRFAPAQTLPASIPPMVDPAVAARPEIDHLQLTLLEDDAPQHWKAGQESTVRLRLRNDSLFRLPRGKGVWRLGYHWSNPKVTGNWAPVLTDEGAHAPLPPLAPGEAIELTVSVRAPDSPGAAWIFGIHPLAETGAQAQWARQSLFLRQVEVKPAGRPHKP